MTTSVLHDLVFSCHGLTQTQGPSSFAESRRNQSPFVNQSSQVNRRGNNDSGRGGPVTYALSVTNKRTRQTWSVTKRYSDFYELRNLLRSALWCKMNGHVSGCEGRCWVVWSYVDLHYPRKAIPFLSSISLFRSGGNRLIQSREKQFTSFLTDVCEMISDERFRKCPRGYRETADILLQFLGVAVEREERVTVALQKLYSVDAKTYCHNQPEKEVTDASQQPSRCSSNSEDICAVCLCPWEEDPAAEAANEAAALAAADQSRRSRLSSAASFRSLSFSHRPFRSFSSSSSSPASPVGTSQQHRQRSSDGHPTPSPSSPVSHCQHQASTLEELQSNDIVQLPCEHKFHKFCVRMWFERNDDLLCPVCRAAVVPVQST